MSERAHLAVTLSLFTLAVASCMDGGGLHMDPPGGTGGAHAGTGGAPSGAGGRGAGTGGAQAGVGGSMVGKDGGVTCGPICDIYCQWGNVIDANGCPTCSCNPPPADCKPAECPPPPPYAQPMCDGGTTVPASCDRNSDGKCTWTAPHCAFPACTDADCGPAPRILTMMCPDGSTAGPVCGRNSAGACGWTITTCPPVVCPAIACLRACPYGDRKDANGCDTCDCLPPSDCATYPAAASCQSDMRCTWLVPGCGAPSLSAQGCYARADIGCKVDTDCSGGRACLPRSTNPCPPPPDGGATCSACGATQMICL